MYPSITNMMNISERVRRVQDPTSGVTTTKCSRRITRQVRDLAWQLKVKGSKHNGITGTMEIKKFSATEIVNYGNKNNKI